MAAAVKLPDPDFACCPRQARGSNECGVFAALYVLMMSSNENPPTNTDVVSLASLREIADPATFLARGRQLLGLSNVRVHQPYAAQVLAGSARNEEVFAIEDSPSSLDEDLSNLRARERLAADALRPGVPIATEVVDSLITMAATENGARSDVHIYSAAAMEVRSALKFPFIKPLIYAGHFSLLHMRNASFGTIFDSLPHHCTKTRTATVDRFLKSSGLDSTQTRLSVKAIGPQGLNDCGIWVINQARLILARPTWQPGVGVTIRDWIVSPLLSSIRADIAALSAARVSAISTAESQEVLAGPTAPVALSSTETPTTAIPESQAPPSTGPTEVSAPLLYRQLRKSKPGQRITAPWWERAFPDDIVVWRGTIVRGFDERTKCILVKWDEGLPLFRGNHRTATSYPQCETEYPERAFALAIPTISGAPVKNPPPGPSLEELRSQLMDRSVEPADSETSDDEDDDDGEPAMQLRQEDLPEDPYADERAPAEAALVSVGDMCTRQARSWFVYTDKPPHVHNVAWRQLSSPTHRSHVRWLRALKNADPGMYGTPLVSGVIEIVLRRAREAHWTWSTIASNLSLIGSALRKLPLYTNCRSGIDISNDPIFSAALRRSLQLARITVKHNTRLTAPMPVEVFEHVRADLTDPEDRLFVEICWALAARVGDARQLTTQNITYDWNKAVGDHVPVNFRFTLGKVTQSHGPYSVQVLLSRSLVQRLEALRRRKQPMEPLWTPAHQERLRAAVAKHNLTLRAIRKGSLCHQASMGVSDEALRLLSGHRRMETLHRYLGWGQHSADARRAALERHSAAAARGGEAPIEETLRPPLMGLFSGALGPGGRRVATPPSFIPLRAPSASDLGIAPASPSDDSSEWPLHVRPGLATLSWEALLDNTPLECRETLLKAKQWVEDASLYGTPKTSYASARLKEAHLQTLIDAEKLVPIRREDVKAFCSGWLLPQPNKRRLRPIFEPSVNRTLDSSKLLNQAYPSRLERRQQLVGAESFVELDFAAFYDQIALSPSVQPYFVISVRGSCYALTRLPMGASFAPGVAQAITWSLVAATRSQFPRVQFATMIDNIRISGDRVDVANATRFFIQLCEQASITLNVVDVQAQLDQMSGVFLGELYSKGSKPGEWFIQNSERTVEKIRSAAQLWRACPPTPTLTRRNFAAFAGLLLFAAHTLSISLADHYELLRGYSAIVREAGPAGARDFWDSPLPYLGAALQTHLLRLADVLIANQPVLITSQRCSPMEEEYDTVVYIDASQNAWAAIVVENAGTNATKTTLLQQRWRDTLRFSAWAEPRAVATCLQHLATRSRPPRRIAVVTDHIAIANGQMQWFSRFAGFSASWHLNTAFQCAMSFDRVEFFYIAGPLNPADGPSREVSAGFDLTEKSIEALVLPPLHSLHHPYPEAPHHPYEQQRVREARRSERMEGGHPQSVQDGDLRHSNKKQTTMSRRFCGQGLSCT